MSQFLIVQGGGGEEAARLYQQGLSLFQSLCGLRPEGEWSSPSTLVAAFPRLRRPGSGIVRETGGAWMLHSGTVFGGDGPGLTALPLAADRELPLLLKPIDGGFVLAAGGPEEFLAITDRLGGIHAYTAFLRGCALVSTSSLVLAAVLRPAWDLDSCREFLATGTVFENRTLFQGIEKLAPATAYRFRNGSMVSRTRYWNLADVMYDRAPPRGGVPELAAALENVVATLAGRFPNPVFDLTGGFDSRIAVAAMMKTGRPFQTVVVGEASHPDVAAASAIAKRFGLPLHVVNPAWRDSREWWEAAKQALPLSDGEYDILEYARILRVHSALQETFDASVNGSNGEICKGYWWELLFPYIGRKGHFDERRIAAGRFAFSPGGAVLLADEHQADLAGHFAAVIRRAGQGFEDLPNTAKLDNVYLTLRMQRWQGRIASATDRIWPCLSPFSFREPLEIALAAAPSVRVRNHMSRRLIEYLNPELASMPLAEGYPASPVRLTNLHRFFPMAKQLAGKVSGRLFPGNAPAVRSPNPVGCLWSEPEVCGLLSFDAMRTAALYDRARLCAFLESACSESFPAASQFGRVLTLERLSRLTA